MGGIGCRIDHAETFTAIRPSFNQRLLAEWPYRLTGTIHS
jgi:hypothetical protein